MGLSQDFRFRYVSPSQVQDLLRGLGFANVNDRSEFFVLINAGQTFSFECAIEPFGLRTDRAGEYFEFLGQFVEALTGQFGSIEVEDT